MRLLHAWYAALLVSTFIRSTSAGNGWKAYFSKKKGKNNKARKKRIKKNGRVKRKMQDFEEINIWIPEHESAPEFPATRIFLPNEISRITKTTFKGTHPHPKCGWSEYYTIWDRNDDMLTVSVDNFFTSDGIDELRQQAIDSTWETAQIHPDNHDPGDARKGNGFPGRRIDASPATQKLFDSCVAPIMKRIDPSFRLDYLALKQTMFGKTKNDFENAMY